jgi:EAL domain-containing protein (putative c-di-GMP-specific phosphodiesterase class I)
VQIREQLGVRAHIDDFGSGASALRDLHSFPGDAVKMDRPFVADLGTSTGSLEIARAVVGLAHGLGLEVIAEGVETPAHLARLRAAGCDIGQGHFLGRPVPGDQIVSTAHALRSSLVQDPPADVVPLRRTG